MRDRILERENLYRALLALVLIASFLLKLNNLGHTALKGLDESFHAVVAANLLEHPLTPTLIDRPYLSFDYRDWQNNHIWLHKGIVPLWQIALSYLLLGINTLALRLPSALLSTAAVLLTYLIGKELLDRTAALVAAALQAFSPAIVNLVHGNVFSDHIDIALLFWVELGIWLTVRALRSGSTSTAALAGVAQGLAFLSKMYPALIVTVVAAAAWLLPYLRVAWRQDTRLTARQFIALIVATILTVAPWLIMSAIRFPNEFRHEYFVGLQHLTRNIENFAAPWDRLIFGYMLEAYFVFYSSILVAAILLLAAAWRERNFHLWLVHVWAFGVLMPFVLATSKTPSATLIGWPAFFLLFGEMVSRAIRRERWMLATWLATTVLAVVFTGTIESRGMGGQAGEILRQHIWILWHVIASLVAGAALLFILRRLRNRHLDSTILILCAVGTTWLFGLWVARAWRVTEVGPDEPSFIEIAQFIDTRLPGEAVLLLDEQQKLERNTLMFRSRRTTYPFIEARWRDHALEVVANGGIPLIVSPRALPFRRIFSSPHETRHIYQLTPADLGLPQTAPATRFDEPPR